MSGSGSGTMAFPQGASQPTTEKSKVAGKLRFGPALEAVALCFSIFLLAFPPIALIAMYLFRGTIVLSIPLLLMFICGIFGTRLSVSLEKHRAH